MSNPFRSHGSARGFTLLELLVVSILISIMLGLTIPRVQGMLFNDPLKRSARLLSKAVVEAKQLALGSDHGAVLLIDISSGRLALRSQKGEPSRKATGGSEPVRLKLADSVSIASVWSLSKGRSRSGTVPVWVNRRGMIEPLIIELRSADRVMTLRASPFLADIEIFDRVVSPPRSLLAGAASIR